MPARYGTGGRFLGLPIDSNGPTESHHVTVMLRLLLDKSGELVHGEVVDLQGQVFARFADWQAAIRVVRAWPASPILNPFLPLLNQCSTRGDILRGAREEAPGAHGAHEPRRLGGRECHLGTRRSAHACPWARAGSCGGGARVGPLPRLAGGGNAPPVSSMARSCPPRNAGRSAGGLQPLTYAEGHG